MNQTEYAAWEVDARRALSGRYDESEIAHILDWFRCIKGQDERDMMGNEVVEAMLVFTSPHGKHDLYNSLMARLFVYAPFILAEAKKEQQAFAKTL